MWFGEHLHMAVTIQNGSDGLLEGSVAVLNMLPLTWAALHPSGKCWLLEVSSEQGYIFPFAPGSSQQSVPALPQAQEAVGRGRLESRPAIALWQV